MIKKYKDLFVVGFLLVTKALKKLKLQFNFMNIRKSRSILNALNSDDNMWCKVESNHFEVLSTKLIVIRFQVL